MTRWLVGFAALAVCGAAQAQVYGAPGAGNGAGGAGGAGGATLGGLNSAFAPNFYNRTQQPLSPYLNLLSGGNPAVNYFYGTRPGLSPAVSGLAGSFGLQGPGLTPPGLGNRFYLQPPLTQDELPYQPLEAARQLPSNVIPTAAHPVVFGNGPRIGGGYGAAARTGFSGQQANRGTGTGTGATAPTTPRR